MFIRKLAALAAIAVMGVLAVGATSASAATTLRLDGGGSINATGAAVLTISNTTSNTAILNTSLGTVTCHRNTFHADVPSHSATSLTGRLTALTFQTCQDTIAPVNITHCGLHAGSAPTIHITAGTGGGTVAVNNNAVVRCAIQNSTSGCYYAQNGTANGTATNATSTIAFPSVNALTVQPTTDALAAGLCGSASTFSVSLFHIVETSTNRTVTVTTS